MMRKTLTYAFVFLFLTFVFSAGVSAINTANSLDLPCVKAAVEKRESAIQAAFDSFSSAIKSALETRKAELSAAWSIADSGERKTAIKNAWNKFKEAKKSATKTFNQARHSAWKQFTIDRKACKAQPTGENPGEDISF